MTPDKKHFDLELKELSGDDAHSFVMYAAAFSNVDRGGDVIQPGAFTNLDEFVKDGWIALNHRGTDLPVGYPTSAVQDDKGLRVEGRWHGTPEAQHCRIVAMERFAAGKSVKASIGYMVDVSRMGKSGSDPVRILEKIRIYEASFVNLPMNPAADVISAKGADVSVELDEKVGLLDALKELLGISKKAIEKGKMSKSGMTRLKAFAEAMDEHGQATREHAKGMHEHGKAACAMGKEMKSFLKGYDPDEKGEADDDDEEDKGKKVGDEEDTEDGGDEEDTDDAAPPKRKKKHVEKSADRHAIATRLAALHRPE